MIKFIVEDMEGNLICEQSYLDSYNIYKISSKREEIAAESIDFLDGLEYYMGSLAINEEGNDFLITFLNEELVKKTEWDLEDLIGSYFFESIKFFSDMKLRKLILDAYQNGENLDLIMLKYVEDILISAYAFSFFRINEKFYFKLSKSNDYFIINRANQESVEDSNIGYGIIESNKWAYANGKFCELFGISKDDLEDCPLINKNIIRREKTKKEDLSNIFNDTLNRTNYFFQDEIEILIGGETRYFTEMISPISFNDSPAVQVIFLEHSHEKRISLAFDELNEKLDSFLNLAKLALCNVKDGRIYWSNEIYSFFEISPDEFNPKNSVNTLDEFLDLFGDFILKTDLSGAYEEASNQKEESDHVNISFRIRTNSLNIKWINFNFVIHSENPLNMIGYMQDLSSDECLKMGLKNQLDEYRSMYMQSENSKYELEEEVNQKSMIINGVYDGVNHNLDLFLELLNYLHKSGQEDCNHVSLLLTSIAKALFENELNENFGFNDKRSFRKTIKTMKDHYFHDSFNNIRVKLNIGDEIFLKRSEVCSLFIIFWALIFHCIELKHSSGCREDDSSLSSFELNEYIDGIDIEMKNKESFSIRIRTEDLKYSNGSSKDFNSFLEEVEKGLLWNLNLEFLNYCVELKFNLK